MERDYGEQYRKLYEEHWWWRVREDVVLSELDRLRLPDHPRVLDVGCGDGLFFPALRSRGAIVQGLEFDRRLVSEENRQQISIGILDESYESLNSYDVILMLDVLEHSDTPQTMIREAHRLLNPAGYLVITVPALRALWTTHDDVNHHRTRYTKSSLQQEFSLQTVPENWTIQRSYYFFHWLVAAKLAVRAKESFKKPASKIPHVPSGWINRFLMQCSRLENRILGKARLPLGSSLLMVAQRKG
jgi:2-polyprenyl-3-methyl-5-hydroxy-6-metoxy-1,4-benzoquinol methylase